MIERRGRSGSRPLLHRAKRFTHNFALISITPTRELRFHILLQFLSQGDLHIPCLTRTWGVRALFHPPPSGNYLTNALNVTWANTFSLKSCRGATAIPSGVWSGSNPTVGENTQCRGVLVSPRHILNVSHCGYWERKTFGPGNYVRFIGTNNVVHPIKLYASCFTRAALGAGERAKRKFPCAAIAPLF